MNYHLFFYQTALFSTSLTTLFLGCIVIAKGRKNRVTFSYAGFSFALASWSALQAWMCFIPRSEPNTALLLSRIFHVPALFITSFFLHFVYSVFEDDKNRRKMIFICYTMCFVFLTFLPFKIFIKGVDWSTTINYEITPGPFYHSFLIYFFGPIVWSLYKFYQGYKHSRGLKCRQLKFLFWSTLFGFGCGSLNFLYAYHKSIPFLDPYALFGIPIYVLIITYAIFKHRLMDIHLIIRRTVIYGVIYSLSLGIFVAIVIMFGQWMISGGIDQRVITLSLFAVLIVVSIVKPLDKILTAATDRFLFRKTYEYHQILKEASLGMISIRELDKLLKLIVNVITKHVRVKHASLLLFDKEKDAYVVKASRGRLKLPRNYLKFTIHNPLIKQLIITKDCIVSEELKLAPKQNLTEIQAKVIEEMDRYNVSVCVPSFLKGKLIGFLLLGEKLSGELYSREDLSLFNTLAVQAGLAIENAQKYKELSEAKDKLYKAEKLASIGRLAGGIAHEIKNPLASIKTFTEYLNKKFDDPKFRDNFQRIVGSEVDRINHIVEQLVFYAHPKNIALQATDLNSVIDETLNLLENELKKEAVQIKKEYSSLTGKILADPEQLKQVLLNLFLNSIQAMEDNKKRPKELIISTQRENGFLELTVSDTGKGIPQDKIPLIFEPFFTTKENGSGLGLSIVKSIVEGHRGRISVKSKIEEGTDFSLTFPV